MPMLFDPAPPVTVPLAGRGELPVHRIFCVGQNYAAHAAEMGQAVDREAPTYFLKSAHAAIPSGGTLPYPPGTTDLHHEVELVVALGPDAQPVAAGVALDMTRRDLQKFAKDRGRPWDLAKDFEASAVFAPLAPWADLEMGASIRLWVNGDLRQEGRLSDMICGVDEIRADLERYYTLRAGDLILTGTPSGVGAVQPGDRIEAEIDGLPRLEVEIMGR